jgi:hypothetical protein
MKFLGPPSSGSLAGTTSSHNRAGQYTRNRRVPTNPVGTGRRATIRSFFAAASTAWAALTFSQQAAWSAYAAGHPITDALGQSIVLTGHQMFVGINSNLQNSGSAISSVPPVSSVTVAPAFSVFTITHLGVITITLTPSGTASDFILIAFSKPQSSGVSFNKTFWQQTHVPGNSVGGATYGTAYVAQFGLPPAGSRVFYKLTPVNQYGVSGTPIIGFVTVS